MEYAEWLERAYSKIVRKENRGRFEPPRAESMIQGNRTILSNLKQIADYLNRDPEHLLKFLLKELATFGKMEGNRVIFVGRFTEEIISQKINKYIEEFVRCKECKSPDSKLIREERIQFLQCLACGAKYPVRKLK
ncbi:MAG: translation initiation factor IF-2 subunit beta [Candidatus Nanoarchaeia archaeon]|nr:translation initiation factor IF-2 subunit beta [Candidatus Haiyanarchaeum thermophilum]MCW1303144.1 translation initiation factor IF-2 subunit beta [Candidatus Haiyanarchaeum thermophilum]MCW1303809.1 translation initiation factor IF-2 subunit beta [Candidatus Haiyanarchaeum thermophilum]MCW1306575.1 translation initiation factor IF-2 subunit beta [Candidatus Haiyanarchaeum thermophilum]MCW1306988.1 translation initiation factor IF-2 subunit beta [Candidatus Haiyanarchaeum thermophilum]